MNMREKFNRFADTTSNWCGTPTAFSLSVFSVLVWAAFGPHYHWSDTYQLLINSATTVITFWMVFLIQSTQNRNSRALHLKLDELILASERARNALVGAENKGELDIEHLHSLVSQAAGLSV